MKSKRFVALAAAAAICVSALGGCGSSSTASGTSTSSAGSTAASGDKVVKIGVFEPSTGDSASGGKKEMLGMQYANAETPTVEIGGETYQVELVYADNGSSTDKAPSAASELVSQGVSLVLGSYGSGVSIAGGPTFGDAGMPAIGVTCTNPNVTAGNDYYFRICFLDPFQGTVLANFATDKFDAKVAYCLGEAGNEYDQGLIAYFTQAFEAAGGTVVTASFPTNNSDFNTYLNQAKSEGADVIFTPVSIAYSTQIIQPGRLAGHRSALPGLRHPGRQHGPGGRRAAPTSSCMCPPSTRRAATPDFDEGIKSYINTTRAPWTHNGGNDTIAAVSAMGYDAYYVALEAIKAAGSTDPAAIKAALWDVTYDRRHRPHRL